MSGDQFMRDILPGLAFIGLGAVYHFNRHTDEEQRIAEGDDQLARRVRWRHAAGLIIMALGALMIALNHFDFA